MSPPRRRRGARAALFAGGVAAALFVTAAVVGAVRARPIAAAPPRAWTPPAASRAPSLSVCWLELANQRALAGFAHAGGSRRDAWEVTVSGLLVRHPGGDLLIDAGNSSRFDAEIGELAWWSRVLMRLGPGSNRVLATAPAALAAVGEPVDRLRAIVISHAHPDHAGGIVDLPGPPALTDADELAFARRFVAGRGVELVPATARALVARGQAAPFEHKRYQIFDESYDVYGDGSVVLVRLPGHTPGSIGTFVTLSPTRRLFHVGDAVNTTEAIDGRVPKSLAMAWTDFDHDGAARIVALLAELHARDPELAILPAHDRDAWRAFFGGEPRCTSE